MESDDSNELLSKQGDEAGEMLTELIEFNLIELDEVLLLLLLSF